jgi:hypothetical protein
MEINTPDYSFKYPFKVEYKGAHVCTGSYDQCLEYIRNHTNMVLDDVEIVSMATKRLVSWSI